MGDAGDVSGTVFCETGDHFNNRDQSACESQQCCEWDDGTCWSAVGDMPCSTAGEVRKRARTRLARRAKPSAREPRPAALRRAPRS